MKNLIIQVGYFDPLMISLIFFLIVIGAGWYLFALFDIWRESRKNNKKD
ncbi:MAG: hypothetical protein KAH32_08045 [Chlamydiia bacterium]|nr:hypothetical protein [Chlamydiia bacterium]